MGNDICILSPSRPIPAPSKPPPFRLSISRHIGGGYFKGHHPGGASKGQSGTLGPRFVSFEAIHSKCHLALPSRGCWAAPVSGRGSAAGFTCGQMGTAKVLSCWGRRGTQAVQIGPPGGEARRFCRDRAARHRIRRLENVNATGPAAFSVPAYRPAHEGGQDKLPLPGWAGHLAYDPGVSRCPKGVVLPV